LQERAAQRNKCVLFHHIVSCWFMLYLYYVCTCALVSHPSDHHLTKALPGRSRHIRWRLAQSVRLAHQDDTGSTGEVIWIGWEILALTRKGVQNCFCFFWVRFCFFLAFFPGTICLVFATVWN
jgi:hypothetical protein